MERKIRNDPPADLKAHTGSVCQHSLVMATLVFVVFYATVTFRIGVKITDTNIEY